MMKAEKLDVKFHDRLVGTLSLTPDNRLCVFEYDHLWLADGFSISPLGLLFYNSGNCGGCRPKAVFSDDEGRCSEIIEMVMENCSDLRTASFDI